MDLVEAVGDQLVAQLCALTDFDEAVLPRAGDDGTLFNHGTGRTTASGGPLADDIDEGRLALDGHRSLRRGGPGSGPARNADPHQHARLQPTVRVGKLRPRRDRPRTLVHPRVQLGDAARNGGAREGIGGCQQGLPDAQLGQVAFRHLEIDPHHRHIVQRDNRRAGVDQGTRCHIGKPDHAGERRTDHPVALPRPGRVDVGLGRPPVGLELVHRRF